MATGAGLVSAVYNLTRESTLARDFGVSNQIQRAAVSIMSNIAEGWERRHVAEKLQFYNVARGSSAEVRSLLYVIEENFPKTANAARTLRVETTRVGELVSGLIRSTERRKSGRL